MSESTFAVIETGGKQYLVSAGTIVDIEKLEAKPSESFQFDKVLMVVEGQTLKMGQPYIEGASVKATVLNQIKDDKKITFKFKRKTGYQKKQGHRQKLTTIKVETIQAK